MSNLLLDMSFLTPEPPQGAVVDCAGLIAPASLSRLNAQAAGACFRPRVVILPTGYAPDSMAKISSLIWHQWNMPEEGLLMVIDLHGHDMRVDPGAKLRSSGLTDSKIAQVIAKRFGPPMRNVHSTKDLSANLPDAILNAISGFNSALGQGEIVSVPGAQRKAKVLAVSPSIRGSSGAFNAQQGTGLLVTVVVLLALAASLFYLKKRRGQVKP